MNRVTPCEYKRWFLSGGNELWGNFHTLYSMDRRFKNPYDPTHQNSELHLHTVTLADLNIIPQDEYLEYGNKKIISTKLKIKYKTTLETWRIMI